MSRAHPSALRWRGKLAFWALTHPRIAAARARATAMVDRVQHRWPRTAQLIREALASTTVRNMHLVRVSIPSNLLMAAWKTALAILAPSAFLIATIVFNVGTAAAKYLVLRTWNRAPEDDTGRRLRFGRAYRIVGALVVVLAALYIVSCLPLALGAAHADRYDQPVAIGIAALSFLELVTAMTGWRSARKSRDILVEAVKLTNLAGALILLVLAQTALTSFAQQGDVSRFDGLAGIIFGGLAALLGGYMLLRRVNWIRYTLTADGD
jgi:hypothetical protein